jgi:hypothetical protein
MKNNFWILLLFLLTFPTAESVGQTLFQLQTANLSLYLLNDKDGLQYKIGLDNHIKNDTVWHSFNLGKAEDKVLSSADFTVTNIQESAQGNIRHIAYTLQHRLLPLQISGKFTAYSQTRVIEQSTELRHTGDYYPVRLSEMSSCDFSFPAGNAYEYSYMTSGWGLIWEWLLTLTQMQLPTKSSPPLCSVWLGLHRSNIFRVH